jgi:hypothetical protein
MESDCEIELKIETIHYLSQDAREQRDRPGVQAYRQELQALIRQLHLLKKQPTC